MTAAPSLPEIKVDGHATPAEARQFLQADRLMAAYGHAARTSFTPERIRREIYFGIYQGPTLVAAAGTHVRSQRSGIAAVGNVLTRLAYRDRGMATSCTSAVTEAALEEHPDVVLNV